MAKRVKVKITWTIVCSCGRKLTIRTGQTIRCPRCGRVYRA